MSQAEILEFPKKSKTKLVCSACGAAGEGSCGCGANYVPWKEKAAADAVAKNPEKSDRMIARETGVGRTTVQKARKAGGHQGPPERKGNDGKTYSMPKKKQRQAPAPKQDKIQDVVDALVLAGESVSRKKISEQFGVGEHTVQLAIAKAEGRRAERDEPQIDRDMLSLSAQAKLDLAIKQATKRLEIEIEQRVRTENLKWLKSQLDQYNENARHYQQVLSVRRGIMNRNDYRAILSCLHPDRIQDSALKKRYEHAFNLFTKLEKVLLNEKESPTPSSGLPTTVEELLKRKAKYQAERAAARAAKRDVPARK